MDPVVTGSLITAGAGLAGGIMGSSGSDAMSRRQMNWQQEFARQGVRMRTYDAVMAGKEYGINPLTLLGVQGASVTPVGGASGGEIMGDAISQAGQNIGRAVAQTRTAEEKELADLTIKSAREDVNGKVIDNAIRSQQLNQLSRRQPPMAGSSYLVDGQSQSGVVVGKPLERINSFKSAPHSEGAPISDVGWAETQPGVYVPVPSKDMKERIEDNIFHEASHFIRNNLTTSRPPPRELLGPGQEWRYSWSRGGYVRSSKQKEKPYKGRPSYMNK